MSVLLSDRETCLGEWVYSSKNFNIFKETYFTITLTSKRFIFYTQNRSTRTSKEIPLSSITAVKSNLQSKHRWILSIMVIVLAAAGTLLMQKPITDYVGFIFYVCFFTIVAALVSLLKRTKLNIKIETDVKSNNYSISFSAANPPFTFSKNNLKISMEQQIADELVEALGLALTQYNKN